MAYPSVNYGQFTIEFEIQSTKTKLDIFDVNGRLVYSSLLKDNKTELNLNVISGSYYVKIENEKSMGVKKIIVE